MKKASEINAAIEPFFARFGDFLKVPGAGNAAGLFGVIALLGTIRPDHPHTEILLKPIALIFALGVALFGLAYLFLAYAFIYSQSYTAILEQAERSGTLVRDASPPREASETFMRRSLICTLGSAFAFFVGFIVACIALIRY